MQLARARTIVDDVVTNASGPVSVFVADTHGELVAAATMDGAAPDTRLNAQRKAYTAARSDATSTRELAEKARADAAERASFDPFFTFFLGGVAVFENGRRVGAVGVSGLPGRCRRAARDGCDRALVTRRPAPVGRTCRRCTGAGTPRCRGRRSTASSGRGRTAPGRRHLCGGVHRESPRALEPELVPGAGEELQEREAVAGGAVAEVRALAQRARRPRQLAAREQQRVESSSRGSAAIEVTMPGAPWHHWVRIVPLYPAARRRGRPVRVAPSRTAVAASAASTGTSRSREVRRRASAATTPAMPVRRPEVLDALPVQLLRPQARARPAVPSRDRRARARPTPSARSPVASTSRRRSTAGRGCPTSARGCRPPVPTTSSASRSASASLGASRHASSAIPLSPIHALGPLNSGRAR